MTTTIDLKVGDRLKLGSDSDLRKWWTVQALDDRYVIATRRAPFGSEDYLFYTVLDLKDDVRGPCDLIGQGWDFTLSTARDDADRLLRALNYHHEVNARLRAGEGSVTLEEVSVEISHRNRVPLRILERRPGGQS